MALADAFAPECVRCSSGKHSARIYSVQREHAGIPAAGNDADLAGLFRSRVHIREVLRNVCVCIKTVDYIVKSCVFGTLDRQVRCAAAAEDQHVHRNFLLHKGVFPVNFDAGGLDLKSRGIAAGKHADEFHIGVAADRLLNASAKVSVTENSYSDCHVIVLHIFCIQ